MLTVAIVLSFLLAAACAVIAVLLAAKGVRESEPVAPAVVPEPPQTPAPVVSVSEQPKPAVIRWIVEHVTKPAPALAPVAAPLTRVFGADTASSEDRAAVSAAPSATTTLRLVSGSGRHLGSVEIPAKSRKATFRHRLAKSQELSNFVASHREADAFVYRRVGVERQA
jgi:hypothetical protein